MDTQMAGFGSRLVKPLHARQNVPEIRTFGADSGVASDLVTQGAALRVATGQPAPGSLR